MPKQPQINSAFVVSVRHPEPKQLYAFYRELSFACCSDSTLTSLPPFIWTGGVGAT